MTIADIELNNGRAKYAEGRTVMAETGMPKTTQIEDLGKRSRQCGTGYKDSLYRITGTDDLLIICHNSGPVDNITWDTVVMKKGYFEETKNYAKRVGRLSRKYGICFDAAMALGEEEEKYEEFIDCMKNICVCEDCKEALLNDLSAGISRRKSALMKILGEELYDLLGIGSMGQRNSARIAMCVFDFICFGRDTYA